MAWRCTAHKFTMSAPDDMTGLEVLIRDGTIRASDVVGVIAKTEGNGKVNDFSRPFAHRMFTETLARHTSRSPETVDEQVSFVMSGGCEGVISPHAIWKSERSGSASTASAASSQSCSVAPRKSPVMPPRRRAKRSL